MRGLVLATTLIIPTLAFAVDTEDSKPAHADQHDGDVRKWHGLGRKGRRMRKDPGQPAGQ